MTGILYDIQIKINLWHCVVGLLIHFSEWFFCGFFFFNDLSYKINLLL